MQKVKKIINLDLNKEIQITDYKIAKEINDGWKRVNENNQEVLLIIQRAFNRSN